MYYATNRRRYMYFFARIIFLFSLFTTCSHIQIPTEEFNSYQEAFSLARATSEEVLLDFEASKEKLDKIKEQVKVQEAEESKSLSIPEYFKPSVVLATASKSSDIKERILLWETLARYNDALMALADGKKPEQVSRSFNSLKDSITTFSATLGAKMSGIGSVIPLVSTFIELVERARSRAMFVKVIEKGEPIISEIIDLLIKDTEDFYQIRRVLADRAILRIRRMIINDASSLTRLAAEHSEPGPETRLLTEKQEIQKKLIEVLKELELSEQEITVAGVKRKLGDFSSKANENAPKYTELMQSQLIQLMNSIEEAVKDNQKVIDDIILYRELLHSYVLLLDTMKKTLVAIRLKLNSPYDIKIAARELMSSAIRIRKDLAMLRDEK